MVSPRSLFLLNHNLGLAEGLRSELILYGINVHCFFPCTIYTPGYIEENKTKPKITLKIEEADAGLTPEQVAAGIFKGIALSTVAVQCLSTFAFALAVQYGQHQSAADLITNIFRASTRGASPSNNVLVDLVLNVVGLVCGLLK